MKKILRIILCAVLMVPMLVGSLSTLGIFSSAPETTLNTLSPAVETPNGGGGGKTL